MNRFLSVRLAALVVAALAVLEFGIPAGADQPRPFKGYADVVITSVDPVPPFPPEFLLLSASATGEATHLGLYSRTETLTLKLADGTVTGSIVFTAANGDELWADVAGGFTALDLSTAEGTYTFTGGTGRFTNASGGAVFAAVAVGAGQYEVTFEGVIQY
jgi:hypothetical protein